MSTRSFVGVTVGDDWRGRYVHSDGYPTGMLPKLLTFVQRDGVEPTLHALTVDRYGWSCLDEHTPNIAGFVPDSSADYRSPAHTAAQFAPGGWCGDGRFACVAGYGTAYTTVDGQSSPDEWVTPNNTWGTEWGYLLNHGSITVLAEQGSRFRVVGTIPISTDPGDTEVFVALERQGASV